MPSNDGGTTQVKSELPEWAQGYAKSFLDSASKLSDRPYEPFGGERIAGTSNDTLTGYGITQQVAGQGWGQDALRSVTNIGGSLGNYTPTNVSAGQLAGTDLSPYMNPFTKNVTDNAVNDVMRANTITKTQARSGAAGAYASGAARAALLESESDRNAMDRAGSISATLNKEGFTNAQQAATADIDRRFRADTANQSATADAQRIRAMGAGLISDAAGKARDWRYQDATNLMAIGGAQEQKEQKADDLQYQDYLRQFGYPVDQMNLGINSLGQLINGQSNKTTTGGGQDNSGAMIGAGASVAAAAIMAM